MIKFGVAGNPDEFYNKGYKNSESMPEFLKNLGLDAYEYQCSRGVRLSEQKALKIRNEAKSHGILLSVHAPYYISLSTQDELKKKSTIKYITDTMNVAKLMGAKKIVVHAGALLGMDRELAVKNSCELLKQAYCEADLLGLGDITICPETMGKINQLGNSAEIVQMCKVDNRLVPTIDFGHLYCRSLGKLVTKEDWIKELSLYLDGLGYDRMKNFHSHFSKMIYTENGGEKCHVTFNDDVGPYFENVLEALIYLKLEPTIICESAGTQDVDALIMKSIYDNELLKERKK